MRPLLKRIYYALLSIVLTLINTLTWAQCPTLNASIPATACIDERLVIDNNSDADQYEWDFCAGDLKIDPSVTTLTTLSDLSSLRDIETIFEDGTGIFTFVIGENSKLLRINFGDTINSSFTIDDLEDVGGLLTVPRGLAPFENGGDKFLLVANSDGSLILIDFGTSYGNPIEMSSSVVGVSNLSGLRGLDAYVQGTDLIVFGVGTAASNSQIEVLEFVNFVVANPNQSSIAIPSATGLTNLSIIRECDEWLGLTAGFSSDVVYKLDFSTDLTSNPSVQNLIGVTDPLAVILEKDAGRFFGLITTISGDFYRVDFTTDFASEGSEQIDNLGRFGTLSVTAGMDLFTRGSETKGLGIGFDNRRLSLFTFESECFADITSSTQEQPPNISYSENGDFDVDLIGTDLNGNVSTLTQVISVSMLQAPDISFSVDGVCVSSQSIFSPINSSGGIQTYTWDFGDGSPTSNDPNPTHDYGLTMGTGTYDVSLAIVNMAGCANFIQQAIQIFNPPTADNDDIPGTPCSGEAITFTNQSTFDVGSPVSYLWDFNGEGTSTDENPTFTFQFGGLKDVMLTTSIPGCSDQIIKQVNVQFGAVPDFTFSDVCLGEPASFINQSNGAGTTITGYNWNFGDGNTSTNQNPTNVYSAIGDYEVSLTVTNNLGCSVTETQTISVHDIPNASFLSGAACEGPIQFTDQSTVEAANITQWQWDFGNGLTSTEQNPSPIFSQATDFDINLIATSNFGCSDDVSQTISVLSAPTPDFTFELNCLGESTQFRDQTIVESINPVTSYFWEIDDEVYTEMNPVHFFTQPGTFTASMTLTTANGCVISQTQSIEVPEVPIPDFSFSTACATSVITFQDQSNDNGDPIISRTWDFDGLATANGAIAQFSFNEPGNYNVGLNTRSSLGCTAFIGKTITVNEQPVSSFTATTLNGSPPLSVDFINQSQGAESFAWLLNDSVDPFTNEESTSFTFEDEGDFQISLVAFNQFGCSDTVSQTIEVVFPELDLVLDEVLAIPNNGKTNIVIRGANRGTLTLDGFDIVVNVEDEITLIETFEESIVKGETFTHTLNFDLPEINNNVEFLCIEVRLPEREEATLDNNSVCLSFEQQFTIQEPFPNPAVDDLRVNVILPNVESSLRVSLVSIYGETLIDEVYEDPTQGLNALNFNISQLTSGLYLVRIQYDGVEEVRRIRKE